MNPLRAVLSDADGTLLDTLGLIRHGQYQTSRSYLLTKGFSEQDLPGFEAYTQILDTVAGQSARRSLEDTVRLAFKGKEGMLRQVNFDELHDLLNPIQDAIASQYVTAYAGLSQFFNYLGEKRLKFAIFTSGTTHHLLRNFDIALPALGLHGVWSDTALSHHEKLVRLEEAVMHTFNIPDVTIVTSEHITNDKPDPEGLRVIMTRLEVFPEESLVLGDHSVDILTGLNAGVPNRVGITHGFHDRQTLRKAGATSIVDSLPELTEHL